MRTQRGFTLMEVAVAVALSIVVIGTATSVLAAVLLQNKRQRVHSELQRDAAFVSQVLSTEIRQAGLGVPSAGHIQVDNGGNFTYGTGSNATATPLTFGARRIILATATDLGILGDLPRPDSNYAVFGPLHNRFTGTARDSIMWHNESNGTCAPGPCTTTNGSLFFPGTGAACAVGGSQETCPWGLRRLARGDRIQIVDGRGTWSHSAVATAGNWGIQDGPHNNVFSMRVSPLIDPPNNAWLNDAPGAGPTGFIGQGWVTTLDRIFYRFETVAGKQVIRRTQCFGDPDPGDGDWPNVANAVPPNWANVSPPVTGPTTSAANRCVGPEVVARNVQSVSFSYFDAAGAGIAVASNADANNVARVEWTIVFQATGDVGNTPVTYTLQGAAALQN